MGSMDIFRSLRGALKDSPFCLACCQLQEACQSDNACEMSPLYELDDDELQEHRLQQLRGEFEASIRAWFADKSLPEHLSTPDKVVARVEMAYDGQFNDTVYDDTDLMVIGIRAARRYIIARDFNVWEDGKWQMVWKLQNNN